MSNKVNNLFWLRLLLSLALITFITTMVEINRLVDIISSIVIPFLFIALFLDILERIVLAYKWKVLLSVKGVNISLLRAIKICFVSTFVGTFVPSSVGGDIFRAYGLYKHGVNPYEAISSVLVDKIIGLLSSLIMVAASILIYLKIMHNTTSVLQSVIITLVIFGIFLFVILNRPIMHLFIINLEFIGLQRLQKQIQTLYDAFIDYKTHKSVVFYVLVLSFLFQLIRVLITYSGSLSMNQRIDIVYFFILVPIIILATLLPVSVGGIGVREGAFVFFFSQVGMTATEAFTLSLLLYAVSMVTILPGGVIYVMEGIAVKGGNAIRGEKTKV